MTDRHYTEPVDEISGTVESASPGGITLKEYPGRRFQFSSVSTSAADMSARILGEKNDMTRSLRPAGNTTPRAPAPEAPCLRSPAHRQPGQQLHQSPAGLLSMTHSLHRSIPTYSSCREWGHYRWRLIQWSLIMYRSLLKLWVSIDHRMPEGVQDD